VALYVFVDIRLGRFLQNLTTTTLLDTWKRSLGNLHFGPGYSMKASTEIH
jgi:hypothetical protein